MTNATVTQVAYCPSCGCGIRFYEPPRRGQFVTCPECGEISEVVSANPIELYWANIDRDRDEERPYRNDPYQGSPVIE